MELPGTRASDKDRDLTITRLHDAYVDGQIDSATRDARVDQALKATKLSELRRITADLQVAATETAAPVDRRRQAAVAAVAALVVGVVAVAWLWPDPAPAPPPAEPPTVVAPEAPEPEVEAEAAPEPANLLTVAQLRRFAQTYEEKFATTESYMVVFREKRISVDVPSRGSRPRVEGWIYTSVEFEKYADAKAASSIDVIVDIADINWARMLANIEEATTSLNVEDPELSHVIYRSWGDQAPEIIIYIGNEYNEGGRLHTRPDGTITQRYPYPS